MSKNIRITEPSAEMLGKIIRAREAIAAQKPRYIKCPYCQHNSIVVLRRNSCAAGGDASLVSAVRFSDGQGILSIDYSGSKYARFTPKIAAVLKSLF